MQFYSLTKFFKKVGLQLPVLIDEDFRLKRMLFDKDFWLQRPCYVRKKMVSATVLFEKKKWLHRLCYLREKLASVTVLFEGKTWLQQPCYLLTSGFRTWASMYRRRASCYFPKSNSNKLEVYGIMINAIIASLGVASLRPGRSKHYLFISLL